jgi:hypothetical protein
MRALLPEIPGMAALKRASIKGEYRTTMVKIVVALDAVEVVGHLKGCPSGAANPQRVLMLIRMIKGKKAGTGKTAFLL